MSEKPEVDEASGPDREVSAESADRRRREARRRFLAGGALALPLVITVGRDSLANHTWGWGDEQKMRGRSVCVSLGGTWDQNKKKTSKGSVMCTVTGDKKKW